MNRSSIEHLITEMTHEPVESFVLPFPIVSKERPRMGKHSVYTPKRTQICEKAIKELAKKTCKQPFTCAVSVQINIYEPIPASYSKQQRWLCEYGYILPSKGDFDNKIKTITDALNGIAYVDDNQIAAYENCNRMYWDEEHSETHVIIRQYGFNPRQVADAIELLKR